MSKGRPGHDAATGRAAQTDERRPRGRASAALLGAMAAMALAAAAGCRSGDPSRPLDSQIRRNAEAGREAFHEGEIEAALQRYRQALLRAWATDDPLESAHNAYNLSACLAEQGKLVEARDWLHESRAELRRAGADQVSTWLLEAKIAQQMDFVDEAWMLTTRAVQAHQAAQGRAAEAVCQGVRDHMVKDPCREGCCEKLPLVGKCAEKLHDKQQARIVFDVQVLLLRASLACDQGDLAAATALLGEAWGLLPRVCPLPVRAEAEYVAAKVHLLEGRADLAAGHYDRQADLLRQAGDYRQIPKALEAAGLCYESSGDYLRAAERYYRVARYHFARGRVSQSLTFIQRALPLAEVSGSVEIQIRLALLFREVTLAVKATTGEQESDEGSDKG